MTDMVKKYVPYAVIILLVYMLLPLVFIPGAMQKFSPVAYDFVFPITAIGCSAHYCSKHGLDFLFALIAPIIYLPSMLIYNVGFSSGITFNKPYSPRSLSCCRNFRTFPRRPCFR